MYIEEDKIKTYLSHKLKSNHPKIRKDELRAKLLYHAQESGFSKSKEKELVWNIITGKIDNTEFDEDTRTFKFCLNPYIRWRI